MAQEMDNEHITCVAIYKVGPLLKLSYQWIAISWGCFFKSCVSVLGTYNELVFLYLLSPTVCCPRRCSWSRRILPGVVVRTLRMRLRWRRRWCCRASTWPTLDPLECRTAAPSRRRYQSRRHNRSERTEKKTQISTYAFFTLVKISWVDI